MTLSRSPDLRGLILDMDGVLWRGQAPIGDLPANFARMRAAGWQIVLATNNSTNSALEYQQKLAGFGVQVELTQIITSAQATAQYLQQRYPEGGPVYVLGAASLSNQIASRGFTLLDPDHPGSEAVAVVVGLDREINYARLRFATRLIRSGALFVATNPDRTLPTQQGLEPGTGAIVAAIQAAADAQPVYIGKPEPEMYRVALENLGLAPVEVLVVGDRLETDILGAQRMGARAALVLSGVSTLQAAEKWQPQLDYVAADLGALLEQLEI